MKLKLSLTSIVLVLCLLAFSSLLLAREPATKPAMPSDPRLPEDAIIRLPDGRELNLADLQRDGAGVVMMRNDGAGTNIDAVDEDGRKISITDNPDGIVITINEEGKDPIEYRAASIDELRKDHPEAADLYDKYHPKDLNLLAAGAGLPPGAMDQRIMVRMGAGGGHGGGPEFPMKIEALGATCLPGVDEFVHAQIGDGVRVVRVAKEGLAQRLALQKHDFITAVNGKPVKSAEDLEEALADAGGAKVTLDVLRAGKSVKLAEQ